jgi:hypothetical protein
MGGYSVAWVAGIVHTGRMGRTVSALVTWGDEYRGVIGPFPVSTPWWSAVEPVVAHLREVLDVPVLVLRLLLTLVVNSGSCGEGEFEACQVAGSLPV